MNYRFFIILSYIFVGSHNHALSELDTLALAYGTDKGPQWHNYTPTYAQWFHAKKELPISMLEIGFWQGASIRMWDTYFTNPATRIYSIDFNDTYFDAIKRCSPRCFAYKADQESPAELCSFVSTVQQTFDIIIDDGGHSMNQQITSFEILFPHVNPGGLYIIEDLHTSYWHEYGSEGSPETPKASPHATIRFLQALIDQINFIGARTSCADRRKVSDEFQKKLTLYQRDIESIHFYSSLCIIVKTK